MTRGTGKLVGGLVGLLTLGPVGAALGLLLGHQYDKATDEDHPQPFSKARDAALPSALDKAYRVLEIRPTASDDEVAKAYRRQLSRHHPDKLKAHGLPESMRREAEERTQKIIEAYELIREGRGLV